uniref:NYN domain-containing protein n=1 Tax=Paramoeba aestuarina TaxID=180227 RepID=A0A7S4NKT2_9EUKA|mmetsp:Transcript_19324/g.30258  ORF Transcript_19324/g.30258 Transcript_19324/m.30258 type:complete len:281 (+) Transcript_19324:62-904(+)
MNEYQEMHPCNLHHPDFYNRQRNLKVSNNKLYINIFHDSENCFLHRNWKGNASRLYDEVVRSIANAVWPGNSLNISEDLIVNWHWVLPAKDNNYKVNEGAQRVLQDRGVVFQVAKDKSGAVDIAVDALMNAFRVTFDGFKPERQKQTVAVLLSGDSDFGLQVKQLRQSGCKVVGIHNGHASAGFRGNFDKRFLLDWFSLCGKAGQDPRQVAKERRRAIEGRGNTKCIGSESVGVSKRRNDRERESENHRRVRKERDGDRGLFFVVVPRWGSEKKRGKGKY